MKNFYEENSVFWGYQRLPCLLKHLAFSGVCVTWNLGPAPTLPFMKKRELWESARFTSVLWASVLWATVLTRHCFISIAWLRPWGLFSLTVAGSFPAMVKSVVSGDRSPDWILSVTIASSMTLRKWWSLLGPQVPSLEAGRNNIIYS